jgi:cysteine desulfurase
MRAWDDAHFENAFSAHGRGRAAKRALEDARFEVAGSLGVSAHECVFVSGATQGIVTALHGAVGYGLERGVPHEAMHMVLCVAEHSSVRACAEALARRGVRLSTVGLSADGVIDVAALERELRDDTILVTAMLVNNELGTIAPVRQVAALLEERYAGTPHRHGALGIRRPLLLVDASQAPLCLPVRPNDIGADLLVLDAHKLYGPKRSGLLFVKARAPFAPLCGAHGATPYEGTPDVAAALGLAEAMAIAEERRETDVQKWGGLKERLIAALRERFPEMRVHGNPAVSVPNILNVSFPDVEGEFLAARLDAAGISVSAKSACLSGGQEGSYVVSALDPERANNSVRFSFGRDTTEDDIDYCVSVLSDILRFRGT